jgi:xanthine dehydrogenase small subunit
VSMIPPTLLAPAFAPAGLSGTRLLHPATIDEACAQLAEARRAGKSAVVLAGGTDWIVDRHLMPIERAAAVDVAVDVTGIAELARVELHRTNGDAHLILGGGVTYWTLRTDARIASSIPMLAAMAKDVGAVQIQTRGTLAGNIATASPAADGVPALMALDGVVTVRSVDGMRMVPLSSFFTGYRRTAMKPAELIVAIDVRIPPAGAKVTWRKVGTRLAQAISKVALASVLETDAAGVITRARFGMASVAAVTTTLPAVRAYLEGRALAAVDRVALDAALEADITPIDDVRSTGAYRLHVAKAILWRAVVD